MMDGSEPALVAALKQGSRDAFDQAYAAYRIRIFSFLVRMTGRRDLAEDLFQETWLRLATNAPRLADDTRLAPWLYTVARNLYRSHLRWTALDADRLDQLGLEPATGAPMMTPYHAAAENETRQRLERAVATLAPPYREVILLCAVDRLEPTDAAAVLGISAEALRQRLARARAQLAAALEPPTLQRRSAP
jgi:RNA polymerase sigma-70 factor (ECF subfamily)